MSDNFEYYNRINCDLLDRIPLTSKKILEVGCGSGAMAMAFKNRCPDCEYIGIEQSSEAANIAQTRVDHLLKGDVESDLELPENIDCLIYGDVLEHLKDPWGCVKKHVDKLSDSGTLIACIPNAQHWTMLNQLIYGRWQLNDEGLFDKTHLRWFTLQNIKDLVSSAGLNLVEIKPRIFNTKGIENFVNKISPALPNFDVDKTNFIKGIAPLQYVIRAVKKNSTRIEINYLKIDLDVKGLSKSRMEDSFKSLLSIPSISYNNINQIKLSQNNNKAIRILTYYRPIFDHTKFLGFVKSIIKNDYLLIIDLDDHPDIIKDKKKLEFTLKCCHAVFTTNQYLANIIRKYNSEVYVFENNINMINPPKISYNTNKIKVFFGALNRQDDWKPWIDTINKAISMNTNKWYFDVVHDRQFYDALNLPREQKAFTPICDYQEYLQIMSRCDVSFMPLENTIFNNCKSDLKAVQAASCAVSILATPVVYSLNFVDKKTAAFFKTKDELLYILNLWSKNPELMRKIGKNAQDYVASNRLYCHQINKKIESYNSLWKRREQISEDILKRIASIK